MSDTPTSEQDTEARPPGPAADESPPEATDSAAAPAVEEDVPAQEQVLDEDELEISELEAQLLEDMDRLQSERNDYLDQLLRTRADFENYRKRVQQQVRDEADRASGKLAEALLPVLDATEAAYLRHPDEVGPLLNVMLTELRRQGLETLHLQDQPFDPNVAEAVAHEAGEGGEVVVAEVLRSGYTWNGRTLRPAMVRTRD